MARKTEPACVTEKNPFSERLREIMKRTHTKQKTLADAIGKQPQTVSLYLNGQSFPDVLTFRKICLYFDVSADWLLGLTDIKSRNIEIKVACDCTGLSEGAVQSLHVLQTNANAPLCNEERSDFKTSYWENLVLVAKTTQTILSRFIESGAAERFAEPLARHQIKAKELHNTVIQSTVDSVLEMKDEEVGKLFREFGNEAIHQKTLEYEAREEVGRFITKWIEEDDKNVNDCFEGSALSVLKYLSMGSSISEMLENFNRLEQGE